MITTKPLPDLPKSCMTCAHFRPTKKILWIIPVALNHPLCAKVYDLASGRMEFTEIERHEGYRGNKEHCGPEGKFYQVIWPDGVPEL